MKDVGKVYVHLVYFTAIPCILWSFVVFSGHFGCTKKTLAILSIC
jgi:hypothetical protein